MICVTQIYAQQHDNGKIKRVIKYGLEAGTIISSTGETPFWLRANKYGTVPLTSPVFTLGGSVSSDYKKAVTKEDQYKLSKFDWGYGLNVVGNVGKENQLLIPEAYMKAKYGAFEIYAGRRKEIVGLVDTALSSGSYIWSGNALPIPKVQISTPNFVPLGFTGGFLSLKGSYAHGWFENSRTDVKNFYLHQKTLYFRLGKPDWKFHFYGGFNHQVQWGGELLYPDPKNIVSKDGKLPSGFNDYIGVVTGKSLAVESDTSKFGLNDAGNRAGNHLGTIDLGFNITAGGIRILFYRQNIYEDGSLFYLNNISDGLNGLSISNFKNSNSNSINIRKITFEYLHTLSQGGSSGPGLNSRTRGQDDYFNNGQYQNGWSYYGKSIGSPLLIHSDDIKNVLSDKIFFQFNRLTSFYLALKGDWKKKINFEYRMVTSQLLNSYNVNSSISFSQLSMIFILEKEINISRNRLFSNLSFSLDATDSDFKRDNVGINVGIIWRINE